MFNIGKGTQIRRQNFVQIVLIVFISLSAQAESSLLKKFNPNYKIQSRDPQSYVADVDFTPVPDVEESWLSNVLVEDQAGVLSSIRHDLELWQEREEYVTNWNLESTGLYTIVSEDRKRAYLGKKLLKYADKRLSGEIKDAEEGSALAAVGTAQKALRAESKVSVAKNIKLKFKARVLQGKAIMKVVNPYVSYTTTYSFTSGLNMNINKEFKAIRTVASVDYKVADGQYTANLDKKITDKINARISSSQKVDSGIFTPESNSTFRVMYSTPFNF
jgi:hypothetical protein